MAASRREACPARRKFGSDHAPLLIGCRIDRLRPGLVGAREGKTRDRVGVERDQRGGVHGSGSGQGGLPLAGQQLLGDALRCQGLVPHEGAPGEHLQARDRALVAGLGGPNGTVRGTTHRPMTLSRPIVRPVRPLTRRTPRRTPGMKDTRSKESVRITSCSPSLPSKISSEAVRPRRRTA